MQIEKVITFKVMLSGARSKLGHRIPDLGGELHLCFDYEWFLWVSGHAGLLFHHERTADKKDKIIIDWSTFFSISVLFQRQFNCICLWRWMLANSFGLIMLSVYIFGMYTLSVQKKAIAWSFSRSLSLRTKVVLSPQRKKRAPPLCLTNFSAERQWNASKKANWVNLRC